MATLTAHNLTVANAHTYFVGRVDDALWVHNCRKGHNSGRKGVDQSRQERLKDLANDPKVSSADRGWIKQEMNEVAAGKKGHLRNPPGKHLAHERGRENAKGYGYEYSNLQNAKDHRNQHKWDGYGRRNKERPPKKKDDSSDVDNTDDGPGS